MLEKCRDLKERWGGVNDLIDRWLQERQDLLSQFVAFPKTEIKENIPELLQAFSAILVDYASSWHFGVYKELLVEANEFDDGGLALALELEPKIEESTDSILEFSDKYAEVMSLTVQDIVHLSEDLSALGEALAERFELEDQLIEDLHTAHKNRV